MKRFLIPTGLFLAFPMVALAQTNIQGVIRTTGDIIDATTPVIVALALLFFFWGLALFILNQANEEKKNQGRNIMIWGIIALFVMLSVFGLVRILQQTFNVQSTNSPTVPKIVR